MLSALCWVPKGALKQVPDQHAPSQEEIDMLISKQQDMSLEDATTAKEPVDEREQAEDGDKSDEDDLAALQAKVSMDAEESGDEAGTAAPADEKEEAVAVEEDEDEEQDDEPLAPEEAKRKAEEVDKVMKALNMDNYEEEEEGATLFLGGTKLTFHQSNEEDPYIDVPDEEDESDDEDLEIKPTDCVIITGVTEEEDSSLEVQIFDENEETLFVHHDLQLPSFPLALAWLNHHPKPSDDEKTGSFLAVGTFKPDIEIWNLNVIDAIEPVAVLGGRDESTATGVSKSKKKGKKKPSQASLQDALLGKLRPGSHSDAVMALSWHPAHSERLASGSADSTVKLWDVSTQQCVTTLSHHSSKVQSIEWNPREPSVLLTGAYDRTVAVVDIRSPNAFKKYAVDSDIECVRWNPHNPGVFFASTENGTVICRDALKPSASPLFTLGAHNKPTSSISINLKIPNFIATVSLDKTAKLWDITDYKPSCVATKDLKGGSLYCCGFNPDAPFIFAAGGNKGKLVIWDTWNEPGVASKYKQYENLATVSNPSPPEEDMDAKGPQGKGKANGKSNGKASSSKAKPNGKTSNGRRRDADDMDDE